MKTELTNVQVQNFLSDYKDNAEIIFLEEGKEKSDLINSAKKRGILLENSRDLGALKTVYAFAEKSNSNGARLPAKEFQKVLPQLIGKPMNIGHNRRYIVGFYIDYKYQLRENKAIAYAVFFKSNFPTEWERALKFHKKGKLSSSFELWSDNTKTEAHKDHTYTLHSLEIAGGALIFEEHGEVPAFKNAKVLEMAKKTLKECVDEKCLVYASKYNTKGEIIVAEKDYFKDSVIKNVEKLKEEKETPKKTEETKPKETPKEAPKKEAPKAEDKKIITKTADEFHWKLKEDLNQIPKKIKCSNCGEEFEYNGIDIRVKCPKCFAILNKEGTMQYPPQIQDFTVLCPSCKVGRWLILEKSDDKAKLRCESCAKEYAVEFAQDDENTQKLLEKFNFVYSGSVCLSDKVKILLLDGRSLTIPEIMQELKDKKDLWVYSSKENGEFIPQKILSAQKTKFDKMLKITLDNDKSFESTYEHPVMMRDGLYKRADELKKNDSVMPFYTMISKKSDKFNVGGYRFFWDLVKNKWRPVHLWVVKKLKFHHLKEGVTHHKDFDKLNNNPDNLPELTHKEHRDIHIEQLKKLNLDPNFQRKANEARKSPEAMAKWRKSMQKVWDSDENKRIRSEISKKLWQDDEYRKKMLKVLRKAVKMASKKRKENPTAKQLEQTKRWSKAGQKWMKNHPKIRSEISRNTALKNWQNPEFREKMLKVLERARENSLKSCQSKKSILVNHKIAKIENIEAKQGYDITVAGIPNFAINCGIFVHNSCPQCGRRIPITGVSSLKERTMKCPKCGIEFSFNITQERYRKIKSIKEIMSEKAIEKSSKGGQKMELDKKEEKKIDSKVEDVKKSKVEKTSEAEKPSKKVEAPKAEEKSTKEKANSYIFIATKEEYEEAKKLKKETRGKCVFQSTHPKVKDKKDHFPINNIAQARNALARVAQYDASPPWYDGSLAELQKTVRNAVARAYPTIKVTKPEKSALPKEVTDCVKKKVKAGMKPADAVKACWAEYKKTQPKEKKETASVKCSCVDCGHTITSDEHCVNLKCEKCGGQMRRANRPGDGKPEDKKVKVKKAEAKVEEKKVELPVDMQYEATFGEPELDYPTVEKAIKITDAKITPAKSNRYRNTVRKAVKKVMDIKKALKKTKANKDEMEEILKSGVNKIAKKYLELKKSSEEKINFYKENAKTIHDRREELGEFASELTDKQIINAKDYKIAKLNKEVAEKEDAKQPEVASETVGDKHEKDAYYTGIRKEVNKNAFPKTGK